MNFPCIVFNNRSAKTFASLMTSVISLILASPANAQKMPWEDPKYSTEIRATQSESRPGPNEKGWTEWMKHHEDRKLWCTEKEVDLLMVGDSIIFEWRRVGRKSWEQFYGNRKAVNIAGS